MKLAATTALAAIAIGCGGDPAPTGADARPADAAGPRPDYPAVFDPDVIADYHLTIPRAGWDALAVDPRRAVTGELAYAGERFTGVAIKWKGNVSLDHAGAKKSWKLAFDKAGSSGRFHGLREIELHNGFKDPTIMREHLAYALHLAAGNVASRTSHARVYVTVPGLLDEAYWGLYINVETVNEDYVTDRFGTAAGTLYEDGDFRWHGDDVATYVPGIYDPKFVAPDEDHAALVHFVDVLNRTPIAALPAALEPVFDVERFLGWLAANTLLANMDGIPGGGGNCQLYRDPATGRFILIPWDMNEAFGSTSEGLSVDELLTLDVHAPVVAPGAAPLIERVLAVPAYRARYDVLLRELVDGPFAPGAMAAAIDARADLIRDAVYADTLRHYSIDQFEAGLAVDVPGLPDPPYPEGNVVIGLKRFVSERDASVSTQIP